MSLFAGISSRSCHGTAQDREVSSPIQVQNPNRFGLQTDRRTAIVRYRSIVPLPIKSYVGENIVLV